MAGSPFATALEELRNRRDHFAAEVKKLSRLIADLEQLPPSITGAAMTLPAPDLSVDLAERISVSDDKPVFIRTNELERMSYGAAAAAILRRAQRPMGTLDILRLMDAGGRAVQGNDPYRTLYRTLMKNPRFKNVGKKWALTEKEPEMEELLSAMK